MSRRVHLGHTQQDAISLSGDSDTASVTFLALTDSEDSISLDDILTAASGSGLGKNKQKGKGRNRDELRVERRSDSQPSAPSPNMSRLTHLVSSAKGTTTISSSSTSSTNLSSSSRGKRRMALDETLINGKDYTPSSKPRRKAKLIEGQSKLSQYYKNPTTSDTGPSRRSGPIGGVPTKGTSDDPIDLDPSDDEVPVISTPRQRQLPRQPPHPAPAFSHRKLTRGRSTTSLAGAPAKLPRVAIRASDNPIDLGPSDDDVPVIVTPRKRQVSRQPSRPAPASSSRSLFTRGRSITSFSDAPVELPPTAKRKSTTAPDEGLLDWLRISPSLSPSVSPRVPPSSQRRVVDSASPSKRLRSTTPAILKSSQPDRAQHPSRTQRARSAARPSPATPQRRTRNTFLPPPTINASGSLELVPETPPRPKASAATTTTATDLLDVLARTPTPSPIKPRTTKSPLKPMEEPPAAPDFDAAPPAVKRRRAAFEELDEESYRPSPKSKLGREVRKMKKRETAEPTPPPSTSRPRRAPREPGQYKLPTMDTPWSKWPQSRASPSTPRATSTRKSSSPSKLRNTVAVNSDDDEVDTPRRSKRASTVKKSTTPRSAKRKYTKRAPPAPPSPESGSDSSLSTPPLESAEELPPPLRTPAPDSEPSPPPDAEPEVDLLAEFADYADWPESPAQSQRTAQSPQNALLRTPSRSSIGRVSASPFVKHPSRSPLVSRQLDLPPSQSSQQSVTTRVLAEAAKAKEDARRREEEEFAHRLEERKAQRIAERTALLPSDSDEEELHLSLFINKENISETPEPERRSRRIQGRLESREQQDLITSAQALTEEELAAQRQMDALHRKRKKKIDHEAFFKAADNADRFENGEDGEGSGKGLDLSFLDGEDRDAIADCTGTQDDKGSETKRQQRDAELLRPVFWKPASATDETRDSTVSLPEPPFQWPEVDHEDPQAVYDAIASGVVEDLAGANGAVVLWLCETALATDRDDLTTLATMAAGNILSESWNEDPFEGYQSSFLEIANHAWDELGALPAVGVVELGEAASADPSPKALKVRQNRENASTVICQVVRALASADVLAPVDAITFFQRLVLLAMDSQTSAALGAEVSDTLERVAEVIQGTNVYVNLFERLADDLARLPLIVQARALNMLGQPTPWLGVISRWTALTLLLRSDDKGLDAGKWLSHPRVADLLTGIDIIVSGIREAEPDYYRLLDQLSLWSAAAGHTWELVDRWWREKDALSPDLIEAEEAEESLGLGLDTGTGTSPPARGARASSASHDESRASSALAKVKTERASPAWAIDEKDPLSLFNALKYAANKVRDDPGISVVLKSRLNQLAQCILQNVTSERRLLEAAEREKIYERGHLEAGSGGQMRLSFGAVKREPVSGSGTESE